MRKNRGKKFCLIFQCLSLLFEHDIAMSALRVKFPFRRNNYTQKKASPQIVFSLLHWRLASSFSFPVLYLSWRLLFLVFPLCLSLERTSFFILPKKLLPYLFFAKKECSGKNEIRVKHTCASCGQIKFRRTPTCFVLWTGEKELFYLLLNREKKKENLMTTSLCL